MASIVVGLRVPPRSRHHAARDVRTTMHVHHVSVDGTYLDFLVSYQYGASCHVLLRAPCAVAGGDTEEGSEGPTQKAACSTHPVELGGTVPRRGLDELGFKAPAMRNAQRPLQHREQQQGFCLTAWSAELARCAAPPSL